MTEAVVQPDQPVYDWNRASVGDAAQAVVVEITDAHAAAYARAHRESAADRSAFLPPVMVRIYAPLRRRELVAEQGAQYPAHPTPAVRWQCRMLDGVRVGDRIRSVTRIADKYMKNGRHYLRWEVTASRVGEDAPLAVFGYVNLWDAGRPEDQQRAKAAALPAAAAGPDAPADAAAPVAGGAAGLAAGQHLPTRSWTATMEDIVAFGDFLYPARADNPQRAGNPHIDVEYARKHLYGGIIIDGNQTVDHLCRLVGDGLPQGAVGGAGTEIDIAFPNPCREGDIVRFAASVASMQQREGHARCTLQVEARNAAGKCLASGSITARLPEAGASPPTH